MHLTATWRGRGALAAILAVTTLGLGMVLASAPPTQAQTAPSKEIKQITLTGAEEVPAVDANAVGYFSGTLKANSLDFDLSAVAPSIIQAHIHLGAKGTNGPVVAFLFGPADPTVGAIHPTGTITAANLVGPLANNWKGFGEAMARGELYVNVHNTDHPGGVIRGQIPATILSPLPPNTGDAMAARDGNSLGQGLGVAIVTASLITLTFAVSRRRWA